MKMNDRAKTRIQTKAITSYYPDRNVMVMQNRTDPTIELTVGSCQLQLSYDKIEDRDADIEQLDLHVSLD